jgi:hypothetical protein
MNYYMEFSIRGCRFNMVTVKGIRIAILEKRDPQVDPE